MADPASITGSIMIRAAKKACFYHVLMHAAKANDEKDDANAGPTREESAEE
jgi:hypothetical protein